MWASEVFIRVAKFLYFFIEHSHFAILCVFQQIKRVKQVLQCLKCYEWLSKLTKTKVKCQEAETVNQEKTRTLITEHALIFFKNP